MVKPVVVAKILQEALHGILAPPTGFITRWTSKNQILILMKPVGLKWFIQGKSVASVNIEAWTQWVSCKVNDARRASRWLCRGPVAFPLRWMSEKWNSSCTFTLYFTIFTPANNFFRWSYSVWTDNFHTPMNDTRSREFIRTWRHG